MPLESDAAYTCPSCGDRCYIGIDPAGGRRQRLLEDCPVCCRPIEFQIDVGDTGEPVVVSAEPAE